MHAIASLLPHLSDGIQNYALCALLLSFHNVEKAILNSHSDFILYIFFIFWQMLLTIEFLAAPVHINITKKVKAVSTSEHLFTFGKSSFVSPG